MLSQGDGKNNFIMSEADGWDSRPYQKTRLAKRLADGSKMKTTVRARDGRHRGHRGHRGHSSRRPGPGC